MSRHPIEEAGNRYGRLYVTEVCITTDEGLVWLTLCDCGREHVVRGTALRAGKTESCGCLLRETARAKFEQINAARKQQCQR